jgi:Fe2+ transport system protein FeoA
MISACTLSSRKWAGRAPDGTLLVRAFIGATHPSAHGEADEALVARAHADVAGALGIRGLPILTRISRFPGAMPHYTVGHLGRVAAAEASLARFPALRLAGGAYRGVGLPDCIGQGRAAADAITTLLSRGVAGAALGPGAVETRAASGSEPEIPRASRSLALDALPVGRDATVVSIGAGHDCDLAMEGLAPGMTVTIAARTPLGGPLVVGVGRARIAVARSVAAQISVEVAEDAGGKLPR